MEYPFWGTEWKQMVKIITTSSRLKVSEVLWKELDELQNWNILKESP